MSFSIDYEKGTRYMVVDEEGMAHFYLRGKNSDEDKFLGHSPMHALVRKMEQQEKLLQAYSCFQGDVETAAHKVGNDRLEDALDTLRHEKEAIRDEV